MSTGKWAGACAGLALAMGICMPALAQQVGVHVGGSVGQTKGDLFCSTTRDVVVFTFGGTVSSCDEKDSGFKIFGGYQFNRHLAVEGSYFDYGEFPARITVNGDQAIMTGKATAIGGAVLGIVPVTSWFSLFGKAGLLVTEFEVTAIGPGGVGTASEDDTGLHIGIGAMFDITRNFGVRAEWERNDEAQIDMLSIGLQVRF